MAEVIEQNGKYLVAFPTEEAAQLHMEAVKKQQAAGHESLAEKFHNLVGRLKLHGIHDADKPAPAAGASSETPLAESHPAEVPISAPEDQATRPPVITETKPVVIEQAADASAGSSEEAK